MNEAKKIAICSFLSFTRISENTFIAAIKKGKIWPLYHAFVNTLVHQLKISHILLKSVDYLNLIT